MDLLFSDGPPNSPETCMKSSYSVSPVQPPRLQASSQHLFSGLGDWTLSVGSRVSNPAANLLPASPASQKRRKLPVSFFSRGKVPFYGEWTHCWAGWKMVPHLLSPMGEAWWVYYIPLLRRLVWPGLLGKGVIFNEAGKECAEK